MDDIIINENINPYWYVLLQSVVMACIVYSLGLAIQKSIIVGMITFLCIDVIFRLQSMRYRR